MSHTDTEQAGRRGARREQTPDQPTPEPTLTDEQKAAAEKAAAEKAEAEQLAAIAGVTSPDLAEFRAATTPVRARKPPQLAMDAVAQSAYNDWVAAERPTTWSRIPVKTYFLASPEDVTKYRTLIRKACEIIVAEPYEKEGETVSPSGVRARIGKEFVLTEKMAAKINKPGEAGKTVLAWAVVDKRNVAARNGDTDSDN
jgi:hypothetical protein